MIRKALTAICIAATAQFATADPATFMFAGQSNMVGIGGDHDCGVETLAIPFSWYIESWPNNWGSETPDTLRPLHADTDGYSAHGPELSFMCWIADRYEGEIQAVKVASNGTGLNSWQPETTRRLHEQLISRTLEMGGDAVALVWVQGANDAHTPAHAPEYDLMLSDVVEPWRNALGDFTVVQSQQHPATGIGRIDYPEQWSTQDVRNSKQRYTDADPNAVLVETASLELRDCPPMGTGCIHYTREGLNELGEMLASAFWRERFPQDINQDGAVNTADLGQLIAEFGASDSDSDLNADGVCDVADLSILINDFAEPLEF